MSIDFTYIGDDPDAQRQAIPMLARCFDEWQYFIKRYGEKFPFLELSFVAKVRGTGECVGHAGLMPFEVSDGKGKFIKMAGVASVATAPEYRGQKIAAGLCTLAAQWAFDQGFASLPLYTALFRVYNCCGWKCFHDRTLRLKFTGNTAASCWRNGDQLADAEKKHIRNFYENSPDFPGKVKRSSSGTFHSWERMFNETFLQWQVTEHGYAVRQENTLAELCAHPGHAAGLTAGCTDTMLSPHHWAADELRSGGFSDYAAADDVPDIRHGECVMLNLPDGIPAELFFPLTDKF